MDHVSTLYIQATSSNDNDHLLDDFSGQSSGLICFYSLKNPSHPQ